MHHNQKGKTKIMDTHTYNLVGFMRNFKHPPYIAELTAKMCVSQGLTLVYMQPSDVDIEKGIINGKVFVNNQWEGITTDIPKFIDISPYCFKRKNREVIQYLNEKTQL